MKATTRLSAQRRIFEMSKALDEELKEELENRQAAKHQSNKSETVKEIYGRQQSQRS